VAGVTGLIVVMDGLLGVAAVSVVVDRIFMASSYFGGKGSSRRCCGMNTISVAENG